MEAVECGAASLCIVLGYHGLHLSLEELRSACDVSRDGTKAANVLAAARRYGMKAKGFRKTRQGLESVALPAILHWNFNHFLVLEGFRKGRAYLSDPAFGRYSVPVEEFDEAFTGVTLVFETGEEFRRGTQRPGILASLWPRIRSSGRDLLFVVLASLGLIVPGLAVPAFTQIFVDGFLVQQLSDWVIPLLVLMFGVMALNAGLTFLQQRYLLRLETKLSLAMSAGFLWHVLRLPIEFFTQRYAGEVGSRVRLNDRVATLLSGELATNLLSLFTVVFYLGLLLLYDVLLTGIVATLAALNGVLLWTVSRTRVDASRRAAQAEGKLMGATMGGISAMETLKAGGSEDEFFGKWSGYLTHAVNAEQDLGLKTRPILVIPPFLMAVSTAAILSVGALRVMQGELTLGMLVAFKFLADNLMLPVNRLVQLGIQFQQTVADLVRLDDVLRYPLDGRPGDEEPVTAGDRTLHGEGPEGAGAVECAERNARRSTPSKLRGELELKEVTFGYSRLSPPLITGLNLHLQPGMRVALVGGSGSGKSTVAALVSGIYRPWSGEILLDGRLRAEIPRDALCSSVALVDQEVMLFEDSVRDNIGLWSGTLTDAQIMQAARDACIHEEIAARRGGYHSRVTEGGANFSGGQRQRLEIARSLASQPTLLVLDEATSALDPIVEKDIMDNLRRRGCTCLIVAHRLSTIRDCDEIIVLRGGVVVERGNHEMLVAAGGHYAELISAH